MTGQGSLPKKTGKGVIMSGYKSVFKNKEALTADYVPFQLPNRMKEINEIKHAIKESLDGKVTHVFINGIPGTGKTASLKYAFRELSKQYDALFCYINCFNKSTKMGALYSVILDFFKQKRPTRKMPSRRGIAYDEMLDSLRMDLKKSNTKIIICLDEIDRLEDGDLLYDILQTRINGTSSQIIGISNNPLFFRKLDPRTKSRLYPLKEIVFNPYSKEHMRGIIKSKINEAFFDNIVDMDVVEFLTDFTIKKKGDIRIIRESLRRAGELAKNSDDKKVDLRHIKKFLSITEHAKASSIINELNQHEKFILNLIPKNGTFFPALYQFYKQTDGHLGDRMFRNHIDRFSKLNLIKIENKGVGGSQFITLNTPKEVLYEDS